MTQLVKQDPPNIRNRSTVRVELQGSAIRIETEITIQKGVRFYDMR